MPKKRPSYEELEVKLAQLRSENAVLKELANTDPLTRLLNRRGGESAIAQLEAMARRNQRPIGVLFVDIDDFKLLNTRIGHDAADHVLREVARAIRKTMRLSDAVIRQGGEEFVVAGEVTCAHAQRPAHQGVALVGERLLRAIRGLKFDDGAKVTVSVGGAVYEPVDTNGDTLAFAIGRANQKMRDAKKAGKNRLLVSTSEKTGR